MNKCMFTGRLTRDPEVRYARTGDREMAIARFTLAIDRNRKSKDGESSADFLYFKAFGKTAEFLEKYGRKGLKLEIESRCETGSYQNKDGQTVYTTEFVVESCRFAESKAAASGSTANAAAGVDASVATPAPSPEPAPANDDFMSFPDDEFDDLPFA